MTEDQKTETPQCEGFDLAAACIIGRGSGTHYFAALEVGTLCQCGWLRIMQTDLDRIMSLETTVDMEWP